MKLICLLVIHLGAATPNSKFLGDYAQLDDDSLMQEAPQVKRAPKERTGAKRPEHAMKPRAAKSHNSTRTHITPSAALLAAAELTPAHGSAVTMHPAEVSKEPMAQAMVQNLTTLLMKTKTGKRVEPDAFDDVIVSVRGQMTTQLQGHVNTIGSDLQTAAAAITACATEYGFVNANVGSGYNSGETAFNGAVTEHEDAITTETTECAAKVAKCGQRDSDGSALYNTVRGGAQCAVPGTPPAGTTYDESFVFGGVKTWTATINSMHAAWAASKDQCNAAITTCADAETTTAEKDTARVEACSALEAAAVAGTNAYDDCYNAAKGDFDGKMDFEEGLATQKELVNQVELLICYITVAMKTINDADVPARTDGSVACGDTDNSEYLCTCTSDDGHEYDQTYSLAVTIPTEPAKDLGWDDKNCAESPEPTPEPTTMPMVDVNVNSWEQGVGFSSTPQLNYGESRCVGVSSDNGGALYSVDIQVAGNYRVTVTWGKSGSSITHNGRTYVNWGEKGTAEDNIIFRQQFVNNIAGEQSTSNPTYLSVGVQQLYIGSNFDGGWWTVPWCSIQVHE